MRVEIGALQCVCVRYPAATGFGGYNLIGEIKMAQKKLQKESTYEEYDMDGDGIVTDEELEHAKEIRETERDLRKSLAQLRMARFTLIGMGVFTAAMFTPWVSIERIQVLSEISSLFYISGAGIVGAYMGTTAWMARK
tara:strand:- start:537 stop:950 length:414 start_codon:yes stop_codon:yes gene_type:complete